MEDDERVGFLTGIGFTTPEARVYSALARVGRGTARELAELSGTPRTRVYAVLKSLAARGVVRGAGDLFQAGPLGPVLAASAAAAARRRQELAARREILAREYEPAGAVAADDDLRVVRSGPRQDALFAETVASATTRLEAVLSLDALEHALASPAMGEALRAALARKLEARIVVHAGAGDARRLAALPPPLLLAARAAPASSWRLEVLVADGRRVVERLGGEPGDGPSLTLATSHPVVAADAVARVTLAWERARLALAVMRDGFPRPIGGGP